jgi:C4-dicarboxylate-specific signal transduction histidine kinase
VRIPKKNGTGNAHIALSMAAVTSGFGDNEGIVAVGQDLTELRELQQQVIHSEKLATLGQLAAGVVHELNNPLTSISVYSEYLLKKFEEEERDAADTAKLRRICEGADRILRFTRDLVAYARPGGEEPRLVDMKGVVERSLVFCEHVIDRAGVTVVTEFEPDLPRVYGVKGQLQQILVNLVTNACDAMAGRNGRLTIGLSTVGERVRLAVTDNGPGIPEADLERVFEPFFSTKPEGKGTGLGLSIVRNIITNHNGTVKAVPAKGGGVTFVVELFASA